jgi:hypothetical protein
MLLACWYVLNCVPNKLAACSTITYDSFLTWVLEFRKENRNGEPYEKKIVK